MNYEIKYHLTNNSIQSNNHLYIYDFGNIKGFLYDNEFKLFKILNKDFKENIYTENCIYAEQIPLKVISIEKYSCKYENSIYLTPNFTIIINPYFQPSPQPVSPPLHKSPRDKKENLKKNEASPSQGDEKIQQGLKFQQSLIQSPKNQWMSLEQIMKHSLPLVPPQSSLQQTQVNQSSHSLNKKSYRHLRQPQKRVQKSFQGSNSQNSSQVQNQVLV